MKKTVIAATVLCLTAGTPIYSFAADPCEVVLCMYGKATGNSGGSECSSAERAFFKINAFKKHHRFNPGKNIRYAKRIFRGVQSRRP
ncbi:putative lipoprotein [Klebsiella pneumoniae]|uniref:Putative lipoprotein n=1 Tax=Klebsiella pneumoniae TaxID=573 RepID=A0A377V7N1_KLEPN|nr:putative lipoprotein [Klebsiella pneumoniae]